MKSFFLCLIFFLCINYSFAQQQPDTSVFEPVTETLSNHHFFENHDPLKISLKYDISAFIRHKSKGEYLPAELKIYTSQQDSIHKNIRLKARGNFRRGHCFFPPIYLNFKTDPIKKTELEGIRKVKMVTHCSTSKVYQSYVMREYLAYKIFTLLTNNSFRVRLLDITYIDTGKRKRNYEQHGFLIEPVDLICKRLEAVEVNSEAVRGNHLLPAESALVALFEYFVGNTDWRFKSGHNMKYIKSLNVVSTHIIPLPYDYDHAGFVNATYAMPQEWSSVEKITDREYLGYCMDDEKYSRAAIDLFIAKKEEIIKTIETFELLEEKDKRQLLSFVNDFYRLAEQPDLLMRTVKNECRNIDF
ncbi:hypothetical protein [uncultured Draconibacterium sp.]|uniref:hypothetical protein n=1 Tax=uncultured Draconibacterium sp. TaxID=1573823 RepID=UPI00326125AB